MKQPTISLCMIAKNEASNLPRCLRSVDGVVDEIILVDTGSTDDTPEIAKSFGAHVIHDPWKDNFSHARNRGLEKASCDWIMWLDADEELDREDGKRLKGLLSKDTIRKAKVEGIQFQIYNYVNEKNPSQGANITPVWRMVRNRPHYRFQGRIHEQILENADEDAAIGATNLKIYHYGYDSSSPRHKEKMKRNQILLEKTLEDDPENPFHLYNLGMEYFRTYDKSQVARALLLFEKSLSLQMKKGMRRRSLSPMLHSNILKHKLFCLFFLGRLEETLEEGEKAIEQYPNYTDLYHIQGGVYAKRKDYGKAIDMFKKAIQLGPASEEFSSFTGFGTFMTYYDIGIQYENIQQWDKAIQCYQKAIQLNPSYQRPKERLVVLQPYWNPNHKRIVMD